MSRIKNLFTSRNIARAGVAALLCVYPLFMTNHYYNITISKMSFFAVASSGAFFLCFIAKTAAGDEAGVRPGEAIKKLSATDWAMLLFLFACTVSWVISDYRKEAFMGSSGRYMGLMMMVFMVLAYFFIAKFYVISEHDFFLFAGAFIIVAGIGLLEFIGFDPFGIMAETPERYRNNFLSLLGNLNVFSSFMCIAGPFAMCCYCFEKKALKSIAWLVASCAGFLGLFICNSDSGYLGFAAAFVVCGYLSLKSSDAFKKFLRLAAAFFISGKVIWLFCENTALDVRSFSPVTKMVIAKPYTYIIIFVLVLAAAALWRVSLPERLLKGLRIIYIILVTLAVTGVASAFIYLSFFDLETDLGSLEHILRFNDEWGTWRGTAWRQTLSAFSDYPFINKLFGAGEDTLLLVLRSTFAEEMAESGLYFDNAHNEFLHHLATVGIVGAGSYIAALALCVCKLLRGSSIIKSAAGVVVIAYAAQSFINILQPITSPFIFVFIALMQSCEDSLPALTEKQLNS